MNSKIASVKINERLEKLDSADYDNITKQQKEEALNKAAIDFARFVVKNEDELFKNRVDDVQVLLREQRLSKIEKDVYVETSKFPSNYLFFKRLSPRCSKGICTDVYIPCTLVEEANVDQLLSDFSSQPSFDFEQSFCTMMGNRFRIYHNKDFDIEEIKLIYYRKPTNISMEDRSLLLEWEWKEDVAELIIDMAVGILAGDTSNSEVYQLVLNRRSNIN